ncbi:hypothetical protein FACS1894109_09930 [Spirochaetia bacterium]|nr:hypothetical protein FACS1894109_09930 [Spirochaetia bacterium]
MKNSKVFLGMLVLVLAFGFVLTGCEQTVNGAVGIDNGSVSKVDKVTITPTTDKHYFILSIDAADENVGYEVVIGQDGKKTTVAPNWWLDNDETFAEADGKASANDNFDKFSFRISSGHIASYIKAPGAYKFGVRTVSQRNNASAPDYSGIVWAEPITFTDTPLTFSAANRDDNTQVNLTINAVSTTLVYYVQVEKSSWGGDFYGDFSPNLSNIDNSSNAVHAVSGGSTGEKYAYRAKITSAYNPTASKPVYDIYSLWQTVKESALVTID